MATVVALLAVKIKDCPPVISISPGSPARPTTLNSPLSDGYNREYVIADTSYDSMAFIEPMTQRGAVTVIPPRANRLDSRTYDVYLYRERHLVECFINKIKQY